MAVTEHAQPPTTRWTRRSDARPGEIVRAALRLFTERGLAGTKMEDVAKAAGISKATIYLYFPTKEDLFKAVVRQELLPLFNQIGQGLAVHEGPAEPLLRALLSRLAIVLESDIGAIPKLVISEGGNFPDIARFYAEEVVGRGLATLEAVINRGVTRGEFLAVEPRALLPLIVGPALMMLLWRHSIGRYADLSFDHHAVLRLQADILIRGLKAEQAP